MKRILLGKSIERRPIRAYLRQGLGQKTIVVFGGMHGDEPKSVHVALQLIKLLESDCEAGRDTDWVIVPIVNPDGYDRRKRRNANAVDINRNFPTRNWTRTSPRGRMFGGDKPASEPETRAVIKIIEQCLSEPQAQARGLPAPRGLPTPSHVARGSHVARVSNPSHVARVFNPCLSPVNNRSPSDRPKSLRIITIHSIGNNRQCNNYDGPAAVIAKAMHRCNSYPVMTSIGYPTPGSFGTWAGRERKIPIITLELPSHHSPRRCWEDNCRAFFC